MLSETTTGNPICELCSNSGDMLPMLLYSDREKEAWEPASKFTDHYVCGDCKQNPDIRIPSNWHFVR